MWRRNPKEQKPDAQAVGGEDFEEAAARVTAEPMTEVADEDPLPEDGPESKAAEEKLLIRPEWADAVSRACFWPAARFVHPAYALNDEEAEVIGPNMQAFLQAAADKLAPAILARVSNRYPEFTDLLAVLGVVYYQKWRMVSKLQKLEAEERREKERAASAAVRKGWQGTAEPIPITANEA